MFFRPGQYCFFTSEPTKNLLSLFLQINHMYALLNGQGKFFVKKQMLGQNIGLAPSSLHSILKKKDDIPGIVLTDYDEVFHNK